MIKKTMYPLLVIMLLLTFSMFSCGITKTDETKSDNAEILSDGKTCKPVDREVEYYTVVFDSDGGTYTASQTIAKGNKATKPANPEKTPTDSSTDYGFEGWYFDNVLWDFENNTVNGDITLKAKWEVIRDTKEYISEDL